MTTQYVLPLDDSRATLETVGGKGASLARLVTAGLPVPDGFHVTTAAYRRFVAENGLQSGILAALEPVDIGQPVSLEAASMAIHALFAAAQTPPESSGGSRGLPGVWRGRSSGLTALKKGIESNRAKSWSPARRTWAGRRYSRGPRP